MKVFTKKRCTIILATILSLILIGSFFDYQISCALFNESSAFGKFFAAYGQFPVVIANTVIGFSLFYVTQRKLKITTILAYVAGAFSYFMALMLGVMDPMLHLGLATPVAVILAIVEIVAISYITYRLSQGVEKKKIKTFIAFLAFVSYGQLILINIIKPIAARPRMRMISKTPEASFQNWWVFGTEMKDALTTTLGIASEEFKSFPSGHSGCAAVMLAFSLVPYIRNTKDSENKWFYACLAFPAIVMFSRIIMGAHFLTDVSFGFLVTFIVIMIGLGLFYKEDKE